MTREELQTLVMNNLDGSGETPSWSRESGVVLYSDLASLRPGRFYLLGINPGGQHGKAICDSLCAEDGANSYMDEDWTEKPGERTRLQTRVCDLIAALGVAPADIPSINLAFARSPELSALSNAGAWFHRCWPVHQALLREVRPAWIVMLGFGQSYYFISRRGRTTQAEQPITAAGKPVAWHRRLDLDIGADQRLEVGVLAVAHPGDRGFNKAGLGGTLGYPAELKAFIASNLRAQ